VSPASRLLLDTHVFLRWRSEPSRIAPAVRSLIATADEVFVSVASAWEAAIKSALGRLDLPDSMEAGDGVAKSQRQDHNRQRVAAFLAGPFEWTTFHDDDAESCWNRSRRVRSRRDTDRRL
jgi:predicted nucleic acid-binding protein